MSLEEEKSLFPIVSLAFPVAKGVWYQLSLKISFPIWQNFIFCRWQKTGTISVLGCDLQENRSSRPATDSKSSVANKFSYSLRWYNQQIIIWTNSALNTWLEPLQLEHKIAFTEAHQSLFTSSYATFKANPLFFICWAAAEERSSICLITNAFTVLL